MKKLLYLCLLLLVFAGCNKKDELEKSSVSDNKQESSIRRAPIMLSDMAYTSPQELYSLYAANPQYVIHYSIARLLAETELMAGANFALENVDPNVGWHLTALPKVIYNYNNTPKYYEFGYVCNGQIVATVTTYAQKEIAGVIAFLFSDPLSYDCQDLDYYIGNYPNRYYGTNGSCYLKNCDEEIDFELPTLGSTDEEEYDRMLGQMPDEDRDAILGDMNEQGESIDIDITERDNYWNMIDSLFAEELADILEREDPSLIEGELVLSEFQDQTIDSDQNRHAELINRLLALLDYMVGYYHTGTLPEYSDLCLQMTRWSGYCGPSACAWVYRGKYDNYNGRYLRLVGDGTISDNSRTYFYDGGQHGLNYAYYDLNHSNVYGYLSTALNEYNRISSNADNGLSACFYNESVPFWHVGEWTFPLYHGGLNRGFRAATNGEYHVKFTCKAYDWLTLSDQPVIIAINCNHYIVAFGWGVTKKNNGNVKDKYFLVTDNGYTTGPSFKPYMRKKNFWNLHYGLTH